jgi:D-glycero-D-manno-heptose 1,7-bisphosphate phosphatase
MAPSNAKAPAVFLDRDGTLMRDVDYCGDPNKVDVFKGVTEAFGKLKDHGYKLLIITNQSGIARGLFSEEQYRTVEREVLRQIGEGLIDATYFCPHHPDDDCKCRKPSPEMVLLAAREHNVDLGRSFFIGDKPSDLNCGRNAGVKTILVCTGYGKDTDEDLADFVAKDLNEAADIIVSAAP